MDNFVLTEKGVVIKITNTSAEQVLTNDNGFISPTLKLSEEVVHKEIIPAFKIKIPAYVSYGVFDIAPGDSISFIVKKPNEVFYYIGLQDARMEGISISVTPVTDSLVLQDKVITPTTEEQIVTADEGYNGLGTVTVNAMNLGTKTITASDTYNAADDGFDGYSSVEVNIESSGGSNKTVTFIDYDGTVVASYTPQEFASLTQLPANPTHTGLTAQGWNWNLQNAKEYVAQYGVLCVGQMYITDDGKTRYYILVESANTEGTISLGLNGTAVIDWGDDSETDTITGEYIYNSIYTSHTYTNIGKYTITINVTDGSASLMSIQYVTLGKVEIGSNITSIYNSAFNECNALSSITIPSSITSIDNEVFDSCYSLSSITIPSSITSIEEGVFDDCQTLSSITIPSSVTSIDDYVFEKCYSLSSIIIPSSVTSIGIGAFASCYSLSSITIPERVTSISDNMFQECFPLSSIIIPEGITEIGGRAFYNCYALSSITFEPTTPPTISSDSFEGINKFCTIYVPQGTLEAYTTAENYPDPTLYTYIERPAT